MSSSFCQNEKGKPAKRLSPVEEKILENVLEEESNFLFGDENEIKKLHRFNIFRMLRFRFIDAYHNTHYMLQRIFRSNHVAEIDLWSMDFCMAKWIYPRIKAFIKQDRHGYPSQFSEYNEHEWKSREEYDNAVRDGKILGGGMDAWNNVLQEILFAFEWKIEYDDYRDEKRRDAFCKKWGLKNPHTKCLENKSIDYIYDCLEPDLATCMSDEPDLDTKEPLKYRFLRRRVTYYNVKYEHEVIGVRAQAGFEAFGKYFQNLWD
ncbi:hypothetical protein AGMMS49942_13920 [Spirochaetia bacterium]|nr:hypothetical protein AGMMS49942_13920 [Spirochaetia bacterium]